MRETRYWLLNIAAALVIIVLLGLHMAIMHLDDLLAALLGSHPEPLAWNSLVERGRSSFFTVSYVVLLATALFHGFYGLRTILLEFWCGPRADRLVTVACWLVGVMLFAVGTVATISFGSMAGS